MKNTTLGHKATTGLEKNSGTTHEPRRRDQAGDGADFAFNGQMGDGVNRSSAREGLCANPMAHLVKNPDSINHGLYASQRKGTASDSHGDRMSSVGPSATKDPNRLTIATASQGHPVEAHKEAKRFSNPDKIYITKAAK
jgi:hypothetical protein